MVAEGRAFDVILKVSRQLDFGTERSETLVGRSRTTKMQRSAKHGDSGNGGSLTLCRTHRSTTDIESI